jgi:hypothetical protein
LSTRSVPPGTNERVPLPPSTREDRAREIVRMHGREMAESDRGSIYHVPSSGGTSYYVVSLSRQVCECSDWQSRGEACKHLIAATIVHAKVGHCADCNRRHLRRDLVEVTEDHDSLTWFVGDELCRQCAMAHGIL